MQGKPFVFARRVCRVKCKIFLIIDISYKRHSPNAPNNEINLLHKTRIVPAQPKTARATGLMLTGSA